MNQTVKYSVGVDVAGDKFDACFLELNADQSQRVKGRRQFSNSPAGFKEVESWSKKHCTLNLPVHVLMEATGCITNIWRCTCRSESLLSP